MESPTTIDTTTIETWRRRLRPEAVELLTGQPLPADTDMTVLAEAIHHASIRTDGLDRDAMRVWWRLALTNGETVRHVTTMPIPTWEQIDWLGFYRTGTEPVGPTLTVLEDLADQPTAKAGLGIFTVMDIGLLNILVATIARDQAPVSVGNGRDLADEIGFDGGYYKINRAFARLAFLGYIIHDRDAQSITLGARSYGDPVELPWQPLPPVAENRRSQGPIPE